MKVLVPLAGGFEEIEAVTIIDILRRAAIDVTTVSLRDNPVKGSHGISVTADKSIDEVKPGDYQCIILPGGMPGSANLKKNNDILRLLREISENGGWIAAICAAPIVLSAAGLLKGKTATCFPGYEKDLDGAIISDEPVVVDGKLITGKGAGCAIPFALRLVEVLKDLDTAENLKKSLQVYWM